MPGDDFGRMTEDELKSYTQESREMADELGLDPYPVTWYMVDPEDMVELSAYEGFPTRYPHWKWGMNHARQESQDKYTPGEISELVLNTDPAKAFLQRHNTAAEQKAVITHVYAHSDFFKNNKWYDKTPDDMVEIMAKHRERIENYIKSGEADAEEVEKFIDAVHPIMKHNDFYKFLSEDDGVEYEADRDELEEDFDPELFQDDAGYMDRHLHPEEWIERQREQFEKEKEEAKTFPKEPVRDFLKFFAVYGEEYDENAETTMELDQWQKDVLLMLRDESLYMEPQRLTKVMNEGWASYWHSEMMEDMGFADADEVRDYADFNSRVLHMGNQVNPYTLGKALWEEVEERYDDGKHGRDYHEHGDADIDWRNRREEQIVDGYLATEGVTMEDVVDMANAGEIPELDDFETIPLPVSPRDPDSSLDDEARDNLERWALNEAERTESTADPQKIYGYLRSAITDLERAGSDYADDIREELRDVSLELMEDKPFENRDEYASLDEMRAEEELVELDRGREKMFEVRENYNDIEFIREFLTQDIVDELDLFAWEELPNWRGESERYKTTDEVDAVKNKLLIQRTKVGMEIVDADYNNSGELLIEHQYDGVRLDRDWAEETMEAIHELWGRPVNVHTVWYDLGELDDLERGTRRYWYWNWRSHPQAIERIEEAQEWRYDPHGDGDDFQVNDLDDERLAELQADPTEYYTVPDDWF